MTAEMSSISYAGTGAIFSDDEILGFFNCTPQEVGQKLVDEHKKEHKESRELYVVEIKVSKNHIMYFIGDMRPLDETFYATRLNCGRQLRGIIPRMRDEDEMFAFNTDSVNCKIIFHNQGDNTQTLIEELENFGQKIDTMDLKLVEEKDGKFRYRIIYKDNRDGEYQIYKFVSNEEIYYTHEGTVSGGSETVVCMLTKTYVYTIACGDFLRMKRTDIPSRGLPSIRRDGTPGTHITFAFQVYMKKLFDANSPAVELVAKLEDV